MFKSLLITLLIIIAQIIIEIKCRSINYEGIQLIERHEQLHPYFVIDSHGFKLIGYSHKCQREESCKNINEPISQALAEELLKHDLDAYEDCVDHYAPGLNSDQFSALVSFSSTLGCSVLRTSTLLHYIKEQNYGLAAKEFLKFSQTRDAIDLTVRREEEITLFCKSGGCE